MDPSTKNLLGAARDLMCLRQWIADSSQRGADVRPSEIVSAVHRLDRTLEVWASDRCPDAPESLELEGEPADTWAHWRVSGRMNVACGRHIDECASVCGSLARSAVDCPDCLRVVAASRGF